MKLSLSRCYYPRSEWGFKKSWWLGADFAYKRPYGWAFVRVCGL